MWVTAEYLHPSNLFNIYINYIKYDKYRYELKACIYIINKELEIINRAKHWLFGLVLFTACLHYPVHEVILSRGAHVVKI